MDPVVYIVTLFFWNMLLIDSRSMFPIRRHDKTFKELFFYFGICLVVRCFYLMHELRAVSGFFRCCCF